MDALKKERDKHLGPYIDSELHYNIYLALVAQLDKLALHNRQGKT